MGLEIERKFLVDHLPAALAELTGSAIRQGYIIVAEGGVELRIRQKQARFFQTIKAGEGLSRTEIEIELSQGQFQQLWPHTEGRRVSKTRYTVPVGDHTAELDAFAGELTGLFLVEVEFPSESASRHFSPPDWFGAEVTEDRRYKNKQLAVYGIPTT
ncbi:CYTH domain-containing protein [Desulfosarcina sp.]|uniref:CYTH domain-containing protein n=1 Tax=Desulfosarcina sp. TaxID=2027861 RepID=UPI00397113E3